MKEFFNVKELSEVMAYTEVFSPVDKELVPVNASLGRVLAEDVLANIDLPDFDRSTMDGYAVTAASTFGASGSNPAYLDLSGVIAMGEIPNFDLTPQKAAKISTGGMLPKGADAVVMVEHTQAIDDTTIEVHKSVAPGQNMIEIGEDIKKGDTLLFKGDTLRSQETGLLAAMGIQNVVVYKKPVVGIISTGDEIIPIDETPGPGQIRDINSYTLSGLVTVCGGIAETYGIVKDNFNDLKNKCSQALNASDMVLISGGSSVGTRDFTISVLSELPQSDILVHGISISPGKPTILANTMGKAFWGLPGHVVSAMVVFNVVVAPFLEKISGMQQRQKWKIPALLTRNIASAQGRTDFVRVRLIQKNGQLMAEPVLGKSGLIRTMVKADGLIEIGTNTEGLDKGAKVDVMLI